ncbi:two-component sensor histidine kinase [Paenibacillus validus]|uniref:histidine kinase n=2 Tax=Paenibacillus validus TaxID=44253 RepID=A0A7X3CVH6_9BACL|nr:two-component sensor histidine kinase [Paenibacillus validus]
MSFMLTSLLSNLFFILFPIFLYDVFWGERRRHKLPNLSYTLMGLLSIGLCMLFPIGLTAGHQFDLHLIPFIIASLYGGHRISAWLAGFMLLLDILLIHDPSPYTLLINAVTALLIQIGIIRFRTYSPKMKISVVVLLSTLSVMVSLYGFYMNTPEEVHDPLTGYVLLGLSIQALSSGMIAGFIEAMRKNMLMRNEMMQIQRLQVIGELAASVSHEVRNPLTVSRGFLQLLLERHKDNEQDARYLRLTLEEMDRAQHIITDYLAYAKPEAEMVSRLQVADELAYVISVLEPYALLGKVEIKVSGVGEGFVLGDKHKFRQCLINLLKNGIEAMPGGGTLEVKAVCDSKKARICIIDSGAGMSTEEVERLGTPYYTTKTKGTGLGTMVAFSVAKAMNGRIEVSSTKGKGTKFIITLPTC